MTDFTFTFHFHALYKEMATHSSVLAWRIPGEAWWAAVYGVAQSRTRLKWLSIAWVYMYMCVFSHTFYCCYKPLPLRWAFTILWSFPFSFFFLLPFFSFLFYNFNFLNLLYFSTFIPLFAFPTVIFPLQLIFNVYKSFSSICI